MVVVGCWGVMVVIRVMVSVYYALRLDRHRGPRVKARVSGVLGSAESG